MSAANRVYWLVPAAREDLPQLLEQVKCSGITVRVNSAWLHAFSIELSDEQKEKMIKTMPCAFSLFPALEFQVKELPGTSSTDMAERLRQMQAQAFFRRGVSGLGIKVGVIDAGYLFLNDTIRFPELLHLWKGNQFVSTRDFVKDQDTVSYEETYYTGRKEPLKNYNNGIFQMINEIKLMYHYHGSSVINAIAGYDEKTNYHSGLAADASFYLARTEDGKREFKQEEDYLIAALEWMEKQGVRLVNISLGYGRGRKERSTNYKPAEMNGSSMIAKAVQIACTEKNMLVVVAAGNEGDKKRWEVISTPADAPGALTVGAVLERYEKAAYSGTGPEFNSYLKPEVAAYSDNGTSISAPAICGFAACLLELKPDLTAQELKDLILRSSHLYPYGNNFIGYGVPLASRALKLMEHADYTPGNASELHLNSSAYIFNCPNGSIPYLTVFHKKDAIRVIRQEILERKKGDSSIVITRPPNCSRTTVQAGYKILEIYWEDQP